MTSRLNHKAIAPANILFHFDDQFAVVEQVNLRAGQRKVQIVRDLLRQGRVGPTGEYF